MYNGSDNTSIFSGFGYLSYKILLITGETKNLLFHTKPCKRKVRRKKKQKTIKDGFMYVCVAAYVKWWFFCFNSCFDG